MKHLLLGLNLIALVVLAPASVAQRDVPRWAPDGKHLIIGRQWVDAASGKEVSPVATAGKVETNPRWGFLEALRKLTGRDLKQMALQSSAPRSTLPRVPIVRTGMKATADGKFAAAVVDGTLYAYRDGGPARKIREGLAGVRHFEIAPDGKSVSYILDNNLRITRLDDGTTHEVSTDAGENLFYGELDWVYQEEVYGRGNFKGAYWSPDGAYLAFIRINEEGVDTFTVVDHVPNALNLEHLKYPKAGTTNPRATIHIARASDGKVIDCDVSQYSKQDEILIVRIGWTPESDRMFFKVQNREQTWLDLVLTDPSTGKTTTLIHETAPYGWVNVLSMPHWLKDGTFIWESERTGFKHLYHYQRDGKLRAAVTHGDWEMKRIIKLDEDRGHVTFYGTRDGAVGENAYRAPLDGKTLVRLTRGRGTHKISLNADGTMLIDFFSSLENPGEAWLRRVDGTDLHQLDRLPVPHYNGPPPSLVKVKARDGEMLDVTVDKPADFSENKKYPVWIDTYSGPDAPSVRDTFHGGQGNWYTRNGIVLLRVNVRTASGRGMKYTSRCYRQFGVQELKDLEDAVQWLTSTYPWADASRVGISGWSYGGYMTAYAMTHSKIFKCGVAGAGVYDWRLYDTIYTERYMATPQNNPDGYSISSVTEAAKNLHGEILIVHGTMDDNVHMQNAIQFIDELQKAGKQNFTFMLYPKARHGVRSPHLLALRQNFILKHL